MKYGNIKRYDIADGEGVRVTLFVSGCTNECLGCFQPETWDFNYGEDFTKETEDYLIEELKNPHVQGLTLLGGEPFEPENQEVLVNLVKRVRKELPEKDIWSWTGFVYEKDLVPGGKRYVEGVTDEMLKNIDVLVDGPFILARRNLMLKFRGSENQRIIDMKKTLKEKYLLLNLFLISINLMAFQKMPKI